MKRCLNFASAVLTTFVILTITGRAQTYQEIVTGDGPVHYWRFEEAAVGDPAKDEQGGRDGTYAGGITLGEDSGNPALGKAVRLDGENGTHVALGEPLHPGDSVTIEAWVNLDEDVTTGFAPVMARWGGSYELDFNMSQEYRGNMVVQGTGVAVPKTSQPLELGTWHHVVGIFAGEADGGGGTATIYLDNIKGEEIVDGGNLADGGGDDGLWYIGRTRAPDSGFAWKGLLDEVALYDRALTEEEIAEHFEAGKPVSAYAQAIEAAGPVNYWRFEESAIDQPAADARGGRDGIYEGGITLGQDSSVPTLGKAARFDGENGTHVALGEPLHPGDSVSIEAWVNLDEDVTTGFAPVMARWGGSYELDFNMSQEYRGNMVVQGNGVVVPKTEQPLALGTWHHVVGIFFGDADGGGGTATIFLDGVQGEQLVDGGNLADGGGDDGLWYIGRTRAPDSGFAWKGLLDEVALYDRALTEEEIVAHYELGKPPPLVLLPSDGNVYAFIDDDVLIEIDTGITIEEGKTYTLKVDTGNPPGDAAGQGDSSLQAWVIPSGGGEREFIGQNFRTQGSWMVAPDGGWVENTLTFSGNAISQTGTSGPVAGGSLVILSSNFDASCCGGGEPGRVFFDNYRVDVDDTEVFRDSFEQAGLTEGAEASVADAGWGGSGGLVWPVGISLPVSPPVDTVPDVSLPASDGNVIAFVDDDGGAIEVDTGIVVEAGKEYVLKVDTGNPAGDEGQGDSSLQAWVIPAGGGEKEFIGQNFRSQATWNVAADGAWVENVLTFNGNDSSLTGTMAAVAGGTLVVFSSNFDAACCGGGEDGTVYFDNFRVDVDGVEVFSESFENATVTEEGGAGELADAGWLGNPPGSGILWPLFKLPPPVEIGGAFIEDATNLALASGGAVASSPDANIADPFGPENAINGIYGLDTADSKSWISAEGNASIIIDLAGESSSVSLIAWSSDNTAAVNNRVTGTYRVDFTNDAAVNAGADWTPLGQVTFATNTPTDLVRHLYQFSPFDATGIRIRTESNGGQIAIDEIEVYPAGTPVPIPVLELEAVAIGGTFIEDATNLALAANGGVASSPDPNIADPFGTENAINGLYGLDNEESKSWISAEGNSSIIIDLAGESSSVGLITLSSDNTGAINNRVTGTYTLDFTNDAVVDEVSDWTPLGKVTVTTNTMEDLMRHVYQFSPFDATGIRVRTQSDGAQIAVDEIEVYPAGTDPIPFAILTSIETGGTMDVVTNLALSGVAASPDPDIAEPFAAGNVNNGLYGLDNADSKAWISAEGNSAIIVALSERATIDRVAWGSDNTAAIDNRVTGTYILSYLNDDVVQVEGDWIEIGRITVTTNTPEDLMRHVYQFSPLEVTAIRIVTQSVGPQIAIDEIEIYAPIPLLRSLPFVGGMFPEGETNLALMENGATAFSPDANIADPFGPENAINGIYGLDNAESKSWISAEGNSAIIVDLAGDSSSIWGIAWSSDNTGAINNRVLGTYTLGFTNDAVVAADSNWTTIGQVTFDMNTEEDLLRHIYRFDSVDATGIRIVTESNGAQIAIDEIEVFPTGTPLIPLGDSPYANAVLADTPVHYWRFEETSTDDPALDQLGNQDGEYAGEILLLQPSASPRLGSAMQSDGENGSHVDLGEDGPMVENSITIEAWVNLDDDATAQFAPIVARWDGGFELDINVPDGGFVDFVIRNTDNAFIDPASEEPLELGTWHHIVGIFDGESDDGGGIGRVYVDGVMGAEFEGGGDLQNMGGDDGHWYIGRTRTPESGFGWKGLIDEVAIYDYALSEDRILNHFSVAGGGAGSSLGFEIIRTARNPNTGQVTITWTSRPGRTYRVETSTNLQLPWTDIVDSLEAADATETSFTDTEATLDVRELYYRVVEEE
jgi:predicted SpoU family rRNA methylase